MFQSLESAIFKDSEKKSYGAFSCIIFLAILRWSALFENLLSFSLNDANINLTCYYLLNKFIYFSLL